ncbi:unnamed protein product [Darwinula stevensoni]|uniref:Uncharacterized protein n=1 Tax=Darwinula stevensoni TaxID=69355 RepID=A0A7R9AES6_9CRUS|nr:unnamed protein product [Darwinula stevensoni]CAG0902621.1 unnamed protein product [Darwinula stevensoni]
MKPAASSDPSALTPRDVKGLCSQIWGNPDANATSIDDVKVQPSALERICNDKRSLSNTRGFHVIFEPDNSWINTANAFFLRNHWHQNFTLLNPCSNTMPDDYFLLLSGNTEPASSTDPFPTSHPFNVSSGMNASSFSEEPGSSAGETGGSTPTTPFSSNGSDPEMNATLTRKKRSDRERRKAIFELQQDVQRQLVDEYMRAVLDKVGEEVREALESVHPRIKRSDDLKNKDPLGCNDDGANCSEAGGVPARCLENGTAVIDPNVFAGRLIFPVCAEERKVPCLNSAVWHGPNHTFHCIGIWQVKNPPGHPGGFKVGNIHMVPNPPPDLPVSTWSFSQTDTGGRLKNKENGNTAAGWAEEFFVSRFSGHGIPHIFESYSLLGRLFWLLITIFFVVLCLWQCILVIQDFLTYPKVVSIQEADSFPPEMCAVSSIFSRMDAIFDQNGDRMKHSKSSSTTLCLTDYQNMKPAASSDPNALTPIDVKDICSQIWWNPDANATSIDDVKVQPSAMERICDSMRGPSSESDVPIMIVMDNSWVSVVNSFYHDDQGHSPQEFTLLNPCSNGMPDDYFILLSGNKEPASSTDPFPTSHPFNVSSAMYGSSFFGEQGSSAGETGGSTPTTPFSSNGSDLEMNATLTRKKRSDRERRKAIFELQQDVQRQLVDEYMRAVLDKVAEEVREALESVHPRIKRSDGLENEDPLGCNETGANCSEAGGAPARCLENGTAVIDPKVFAAVCAEERKLPCLNSAVWHGPNLTFRCIGIWQVCDKKADCKDESDETFVCDRFVELCEATKSFMCNESNSCIPGDMRCNGVPDCKDGFDEQNCTEYCRSIGAFGCETKGGCVSLDKRCNSVFDCPDMSDEMHCKDVTGDFGEMITKSRTKDMSDLMQVYSPDPDEVDKYGIGARESIVSCSFDNRDCSYKQSDDYGKCFTFNSPFLEKYVMDSNGSYVKQNVTPLYTSTFGYQHGLRVILQLDVQDSFSVLARYKGARVVIHPRSQLPFPEGQGFNLPPGMVTTASLTREDIGRVGSPYGDCKEWNWIHLGNYSQSACTKVCSEGWYRKQCGCKKSVNPLFDSLTDMAPCNPLNFSQLTCLMEVEAKFIAQELKCLCPPACMEVKYRPTLSQVLPNENFLYALSFFKKFQFGSDVCSSPDEDRNTAYLHVYFEDNSYTLIQESPACTWVTLVSNLGGSIGLFAGLSLITVVELFVFFVEFFSFWYLKRRQRVLDGKNFDAVTGVAAMNDPAAAATSHTSPDSVKIPLKETQETEMQTLVHMSPFFVNPALEKKLKVAPPRTTY